VADDPKKDDEGLSDTAKAMRTVEPFMSAAWRLVGGCVVGVLMGWLVDRWFGTGPWGLVILSMVGIVIGFWGLVSTISKLDRKKK
jgi:ATP synthase protein I